MSSCAPRAGSPCRTGRGRVAAQYHTSRFRLVPHLAKALSVPVPPLRKPGSAWAELPRPAAAGAIPAGHVRIGYARASTVRQSLDIQMDSLKAGRSPWWVTVSGRDLRARKASVTDKIKFGLLDPEPRVLFAPTRAGN